MEAKITCKDNTFKIDIPTLKEITKAKDLIGFRRLVNKHQTIYAQVTTSPTSKRHELMLSPLPLGEFEFAKIRGKYILIFLNKFVPNGDYSVNEYTVRGNVVRIDLCLN